MSDVQKNDLDAVRGILSGQSRDPKTVNSLDEATKDAVRGILNPSLVEADADPNRSKVGMFKSELWPYVQKLQNSDVFEEAARVYAKNQDLPTLVAVATQVLGDAAIAAEAVNAALGSGLRAPTGPYGTVDIDKTGVRTEDVTACDGVKMHSGGFAHYLNKQGIEVRGKGEKTYLVNKEGEKISLDDACVGRLYPNTKYKTAVWATWKPTDQEGSMKAVKALWHNGLWMGVPDAHYEGKNTDSNLDEGSVKKWVEDKIASALVEFKLPKHKYEEIENVVFTKAMEGRLGDGQPSEDTAEAIYALVAELAETETTPRKPEDIMDEKDELEDEVVGDIEAAKADLEDAEEKEKEKEKEKADDMEDDEEKGEEAEDESEEEIFDLEPPDEFGGPEFERGDEGMEVGFDSNMNGIPVVIHGMMMLVDEPGEEPETAELEDIREEGAVVKFRDGSRRLIDYPYLSPMGVKPAIADRVLNDPRKIDSTVRRLVDEELNFRFERKKNLKKPFGKSFKAKDRRK